eukprot:Hpha_TRINITY_DN15462_c0_g10::TRINITY_DN15462_c0_g10_i3::g.175711::m.175711
MGTRPSRPPPLAFAVFSVLVSFVFPSLLNSVFSPCKTEFIQKVATGWGGGRGGSVGRGETPPKEEEGVARRANHHAPDCSVQHFLCDSAPSDDTIKIFFSLPLGNDLPLEMFYRFHNNNAHVLCCVW